MNSQNSKKVREVEGGHWWVVLIFPPFGVPFWGWRGTLVHKYFIRYYLLHDIVYTKFPGHSVVSAWLLGHFFVVKTEEVTGLCKERARP